MAAILLSSHCPLQAVRVHLYHINEVPLSLTCSTTLRVLPQSEQACSSWVLENIARLSLFSAIIAHAPF
jgi:hypothetical protein